MGSVYAGCGGPDLCDTSAHCDMPLCGPSPPLPPPVSPPPTHLYTGGPGVGQVVISAAWQPFTREETELLSAVVAEGVEAPSQEVADLASSVKVRSWWGSVLHCVARRHTCMAADA